MICGHCGNKMTGISSTSSNKKIHNYYKCGGNNKGICKKRTVRKQFIEDEVIAAIVGDGTERNKYGVLTDEFIDLVAAETYLLIQSEQNDTEIKRLENLVAENQKAINNLMQALMLGKIADTILAQIEKLENENKELQDTIANEKAMQINYSYADIRKWLSHFRTLDYSKTKNRKDLIDTFIYRVILYDDKMKVLFHLKGGQQGELLLNLIFSDYPDGHGDDGENTQKMPENEKETDKAVSNSDINAECAYTSRLVEVRGVEPRSNRPLTLTSTCLSGVLRSLTSARRRASDRQARDDSGLTGHWDRVVCFYDAACPGNRKPEGDALTKLCSEGELHGGVLLRIFRVYFLFSVFDADEPAACLPRLRPAVEAGTPPRRG